MKKQIILLLLPIIIFCMIGTSSAENTTTQNTPEILIISSSPNEVALINKVAEDPSIKNQIKLRGEPGRTDTNLTYEVKGDLIIFGTRSGLSAPVWETLKDKVKAAKNNGSYVMICVEPSARQNYAPILELQNIDTNDTRYIQTLKYLNYTSYENLKRLTIFLAVSFFNYTATIEPPIERPLWGIYHPDAPEIFNNLTSYLQWYNNTGKYNESSPTIGILTTEYTDMARDGPLLDALIRAFEAKNANVIVATYTYRDPKSIEYFLLNGKPVIDAAIVISRGSLLNSQNWTQGIKDLQKLNVTVLNGIRLFSPNMTVQDWENSIQGVPSSELYQLAFAEMDGIIEPIVISAKETDPQTGIIYNKPIPYQIEWLVNRTLSWAKLKRLPNSLKKIVITYYSEGGGKANVGADIDYYLNAQASIKRLLEAMKERGYYLGKKPLPSEDELAKLMAEIGSNIGTWAPGELEKRVKEGQVILISEEEYLRWFNELPEDKKKEVIDAWGPPPGKIMVYSNSTGKYIVIPMLEFGNILLAPEPVWGWLQDNTTLYNTGKLPPTHQILAFYWWINKVYGADAILSIFSIVELMPGKQAGLSAKDWGAILLQDTPIIHVLPMDAPAIFDKRRANMLIINFMTPVLLPTSLYGNLTTLYDNIKLYRETTDPTLKEAYKNEIINQTADLGLEYNPKIGFEEFIDEITGYLEDIKASYMPYGSHTLGVVPEGDQLIQLLQAMLPEKIDKETSKLLLKEVILNNLTAEEAQFKIFGNTTPEITEYLELAIDYNQRIIESKNEITSILNALEGAYITPGPRGDPIKNPEALPTGRNPYPFDPRTIPTKVAWETGKKLVDKFLEEYLEKYGEYPVKIAYVLWACETMRHQGVMESEILYLLGVKPVWDTKGRVKDVELITDLGRPRIDVTIITSGLYRDLHIDLISLLDKAIKLAAGANDTSNYVKINSEKIYEKLKAEDYNETEAMKFSLLRIFSEEPGAYSPGLQEAIPASNTWEERMQLAEFYIERMSAAYSTDTWGVKIPNVFEENLREVNVSMFSRSSNLYGVLEHPMVAAYLGGLSLAIEKVSGAQPSMYISNLKGEAKIETFAQFFNRDILSRYSNPVWIKGMMENGYDGARYMDSFIENLWMWQVTNPSLVKESTWNQVTNIYVMDTYNLGLKDFFNNANPYARTSIIARLLETARKGYWNPTPEVKTSLANEYINMVNQYGVVCCHHTCSNIVFNQWLVKLSSLNSAALKKFAGVVAAATGAEITIPGTPGTPSVQGQPGTPGAPGPSPGYTGTTGTGSQVSGRVGTFGTATLGVVAAGAAGQQEVQVEGQGKLAKFLKFQHHRVEVQGVKCHSMHSWVS
ncbi:MAG: cobaltochelatase subunit CobN [Methanobacteriaceae archaeon]|nr:cobaltochelatase subunit CobN [Methanobacteriaceae archaeon]